MFTFQRIVMRACGYGYTINSSMTEATPLSNHHVLASLSRRLGGLLTRLPIEESIRIR